MKVTLRRFTLEDIPLKVRWINDSRNNRYLHYDLPLEETKTAQWFLKVQNSETRLDLTIECDGIPVGIAGLLEIDRNHGCAELYITVGEEAYKGKGIAREAMRLLLQTGFCDLGLHRIYLLTETGNIPAVRAYDKFGFVREGCLRDEFRNARGEYVSRYVYSMLDKEFEEQYGTDAYVTGSLSGAKS